MLEWYHVVLIVMAGGAAILAWRVPNAALWVAVGFASYVVSAVLHNNEVPFATLIGAFTNALICLAIYFKGVSPWETRLMSCFTLMILVELLFVTGVIETQYIFAVTLEIINAYALLLIWATGIAERVGDGHSFSDPYRRVLASFNRSLLTERKEYPQWWKHP